VTAVVYDTGVLIAADRKGRRVWADHRVRLERGIVPIVPAPVVAQASRSPRQAQLRRLLRGCDVVALDEAGAHQAGALLGKAGTDDICDAVVVAVAARIGAEVVTSDRNDIRRLVSAARRRIPIIDL